MKRTAFPIGFFILLLTILSACNKKDDDVPDPELVEIAGEKYTTVKIGNQTWTSVNYNGTGGEKYDASNSRPEYGKYYTFNEAKAIALPAGWRLPTKADFQKLGETQGIIFTNSNAFKQDAIKKLASKSRWLLISGNNQSGFNAYPAGYMFGNDGAIEGDISEFWTIENYTFSIQESADGVNHNIRVYDNSSSDKYRFNVRFVKDN